MKKYRYLSIVMVTVILASCGSSKTYFTSEVRSRVEASHVPLQKIQFYADRDIVLRRELETGETKVNSGKLKFENGHYVNIITLKKNTPGVCTYVNGSAVGIAFEQGSNKFLTFGKTKHANSEDPYRILANNWEGEFGVIQYEGKQYYIQPEGTEAGIMIKSKVLNTSTVEEREMKGRKVD